MIDDIAKQPAYPVHLEVFASIDSLSMDQAVAAMAGDGAAVTVALPAPLANGVQLSLSVSINTLMQFIDNLAAGLSAYLRGWYLS